MRPARAVGAATVLAVAVAAPAAAVDTAQSLAETLCDRTIHVYYGIGNQIEYLSPSGESFFWYPGEDEIVSGTWRTLESVTGAPQVCFHYPEGGPWPGSTTEEFCLDGAWFMSTFLDDGLRDGDPYNLRSGTPPFLLEAEPPVNVGKMGENFPSTGRTTFCGIATA